MKALLAGALISVGALVSVLQVSNLSPESNRLDSLRAQIQELKSMPQSVAVLEKIADTHRQLNELSESERILYERCKALSADWNSTSGKDYCLAARNLAAVYTEHGCFDQALRLQDVVIDYDRRLYGAKSNELARDHNNRALCLYLKGTTMESKVERDRFFQKALAEISASNALWNELKSKQSAFNIKNNNDLQSLITRDIASSSG